MDHVPAPQVNETSADKKKKKILLELWTENLSENNVPRHIYLFNIWLVLDHEG